jgi:AcrR family transcriptional regulator
MARKKTPRDESETQQQLLKATLDVMREKGIDGVSGRAIANKAGVNQALVFYHFESVNKLVIAAVTDMSNGRYDAYKDRMLNAKTFTQAVETFLQIFEDDRKNQCFAVLTHFMAGAQNDPEIAAAAKTLFDRWIALASDIAKNISEDVSLPIKISNEDLGFAAIAFTMGIQYMGTIKEYKTRTDELIGEVNKMLPVLAMVSEMFTKKSN